MSEHNLISGGDVRAVDTHAEAGAFVEPAGAVARENTKVRVSAAPAESAGEMGTPAAEMPVLELRDVASIKVGADLIRRDHGNIDQLVRYLAVWPQLDPIHIAPDGRLLDGDSLRAWAALKTLDRKRVLCLVIRQ